RSLRRAGVFEETPYASSLSLRGFLFWQAEPARRDPNCFGAEGPPFAPQILPPATPPAGKRGFFFLRSGCFGLRLRVPPLSQAASLPYRGRALHCRRCTLL